MSRRQLLALLATAAVVVLLVYLGLATDAGRGSALSRGPEGWLAARRYLEARGAEVRLLDRPPGAGGGEEAGAVLVEVFPWRSAAGLGAAGGGARDGRTAALRRHVAAGGDLVIAYSGGFDGREDDALESLGLGLRPLRGEPPLAPAAWWRDARLTWRLLPEVPSPAGPGDQPAGVLELPAPRWAPRAPAGADVLYRSPEELPVAFALRRGRGRIVVLPAVALANASLADAGNADLLEGLLESLGRRWAFDEHAHGLAAPAAGEAGGPGLAFDLVIAHLAVLYLLAAVALGRRFGPAWREAPAASGSTAAFLLRLGALHDRLGHHRDAARRLVERWRELHPRTPPPETLVRDAEDAGTAGLVAVARELARRRPGAVAAGAATGGARSAILAGAAPAGGAETRR